MLKMQSKVAESRAATMTLNEACGGAPECVENLEAALKVHGAMFGANDQTLVIRREVRRHRATCRLPAVRNCFPLFVNNGPLGIRGAAGGDGRSRSALFLL